MAVITFGADHVLTLGLAAFGVLVLLVGIFWLVSRPEPDAQVALADYRRQMEALSRATGHEGEHARPTMPAGFATKGSDADVEDIPDDVPEPAPSDDVPAEEDEAVEEATFELNANFPGICSRCQRPFAPGTPITMTVLGTKRTRRHRQCLLPGEPVAVDDEVTA